MMTRHWDEMSAVRSVEFDRTTHTLRIGFESGAVYDFADVPERVYEELIHSRTRDVVFHQHVRDEFVSRRVGEIDLAEIAEERREDAILGRPLTDEGPADAQDDEAPPLHGSRHTWVVDVIDEDSAAVEIDGRQVTSLPRWLLPADAREGDVLRVVHVRSRSRSTVSIEVDREAKRVALERSAEQLRDMPVTGRGNVDL
jgi:hypothetical protein